MNMPRVGLILLALSFSALAARAAEEPDSRTATITDRANAESQVSALTVTNVDARFGFEKPDDRGRIVVTTGSIELAVPLRAISLAVMTGPSWIIKYQSPAGEAEVSGTLAPASILSGDSDFGSFALPLARLKRLEFAQPGTATRPARRVTVFDQAGGVRSGAFAAVLTLADGSRLEAAQLRRNQVYAERVSDPMLLGQGSFAVGCTNFTDFRLIRGETLLTIPFENVLSAQFLPGDEVLVRSKSGREATMKVQRRVEETLEGFNGSSSRGDFYVPLKFVKSIAFGTDAK